ncbi:hypothetical protein [Photobacterium leiognathi]|uniref:hypothetical protein n=1 Tax=Photobacterium leiognathi TaxID=553611 RepID=UPI00298192B5|nr:hypothetical protein [Photobacterium leiognathi]
MRVILEALKHGDVSIVQKYQECSALWEDLLVNIDSLSVEELAKVLSNAQFDFEGVAGSRSLGKKLMGFSGYSYLYSCTVGFEDNGFRAFKLSKAFEASFCSSEVKGASRRAAKEYAVEDYA